MKNNLLACEIQDCPQCKNLNEYHNISKPFICFNSKMILQNATVLNQIQNQFNIIILKSTLDLIQQQNKLVYNFVKNLPLFNDQLYEITAVKPYNEMQAIEKVVQYYKQHCQCVFDKSIQFLYFKEMQPSFDVIQSRIQQFSDIKLNQSQQIQNTLFMPYQNDQHFKCTITCYQKGNIGSALLLQQPIFFANKFCVNRAISGDTVGIKVFLPQYVKDNEDIQPNVNYCYSNDVGMEIIQKDYQELKIQKIYACVVNIQNRGRQDFIATIKADYDYILDENQQIVGVKPTQTQLFSTQIQTYSNNITNMYLTSSQDLSCYIGHRIKVKIIEWNVNNIFPQCIFQQDLGIVGQNDAEAYSIFFEHNIQYNNVELIQQVKDELPKQILNDEFDNNRIDYTEQIVCSIDPPGCKDIDDALSAFIVNDSRINLFWHKYLNQEQLNLISQLRDKGEQIFEIGVHIADVSHYVQQDSMIDNIARDRSTTVYLPDRRIDLLPKLLTEHVCSLVDIGPRYCLSCLCLMNKTNVIKYIFVKTKILNRKNMTYQQAHDILTNQTNDQSCLNMKDTVQILYNIASQLKHNRVEQGAIELESVQLDFKLDQNKNPISFKPHESIDTMSTVEEFMLLANICAAKFIYENQHNKALLRRHESPNQLIVDELRQKLLKLNPDIYFDATSNKTLQKSIELLPEQIRPTIQNQLTLCMKPAKYFCSSQYPYSEFKHYGLNEPIYTHFTSPIRRYSDQIVHRLISNIISQDKSFIDKITSKQLEDIAAHLNYKKEQADRASREFDTIFSCKYVLLQMLYKNDFKQKVQGKIINQYKQYVTIMIEQYNVNIDIVCQQIINDKFRFIENGKLYNMFDTVNVIISFDINKKWEFRLRGCIDQ